MADWVTRQPGKGIYAILATMVEIAKYPFWLLQYQVPARRPDPAWTVRQALGVRIAKAISHHMVVVKKATTLTLEAGKEGARFLIIQPYAGDRDHYRGVASQTSLEVKPVGAVWHPEAPKTENGSIDIVLHFHGGAYVYGDGRDKEMAFPASQFLQYTPATHVLTPGYRLSSNPGGQFPAALQDAISTYLYLTKTLGIPSSRITISGDSAGGNLALCLLRYIHHHAKELDINWPACVWLWSPWPNVYACLDENYFWRQSNFKLDFVGPNFGLWGASTVCGIYTGPYLDPLNNSHESKSPIFVQGGAVEVVLEDIKHLAKNFEAKGNIVEMMIQDHCPHDILASAQHLGFEREAARATQRAGQFLSKYRYQT